MLPALIALGDTIRTPEGLAARVTSKAQDAGSGTPYRFGYATRTGLRAECPFPADVPVVLLHSAGTRAVA